MQFSGTPVPRPLAVDDYRFLQQAAEYLERPSFLLRLANLAGKPAEVLLDALPGKAQSLVADATSAALRNALEWALKTLPKEGVSGGERSRFAIPGTVSRHMHTAMAATTGAVGGFFGLSAVALEIPATTVVMLRSIARIAAEQGADLSDPMTRLHCLSVFSFGSPSLEKMESAYFTGRLGIAFALRDATAFVSARTAREVAEAISRGTAPVLVLLLNQIASRFQIVVTQKLAAQAVPIAGAASGALINAAFTDHFNTVARFHFGILGLEKIYGKEAVQAAYREARLAQIVAVADEG